MIISLILLYILFGASFAFFNPPRDGISSFMLFIAWPFFVLTGQLFPVTPSSAIKNLTEPTGEIYKISEAEPTNIELLLLKNPIKALGRDGLLLSRIKNQTKEMIDIALAQNIRAINFIDTNVYPIKDWPVSYFKYLNNVELKRQFIKERGKEVYEQFDNFHVIQIDEEYALIGYSIYQRSNHTGSRIGESGPYRALIYKCPSSGDTYFTQVDSNIHTLGHALLFLNNGMDKEQLAYES